MGEGVRGGEGQVSTTGARSGEDDGAGEPRLNE